jgi:hypothetical protein
VRRADLRVAGQCSSGMVPTQVRGSTNADLTFRELDTFLHLAYEENYKSNRQKYGNLYRICARVGKMFQI